MEEAYCNETSGIAASKINDRIFYIHIDSGDTTRFFAISNKGNVVSTCYFKGDPNFNLTVKDCEDVATGPGPIKGKNYIYLGDIGDNAEKRRYISVYRFEEPKKFDAVTNLERQVAYFKYPDGPHDAETLMVDPLLKSLYIISKRQDTVGIYSASLNFKDGEIVILSKRGSLYITELLVENGLFPVTSQLTVGRY